MLMSYNKGIELLESSLPLSALGKKVILLIRKKILFRVSLARAGACKLVPYIGHSFLVSWGSMHTKLGWQRLLETRSDLQPAALFSNKSMQKAMWSVRRLNCPNSEHTKYDPSPLLSAFGFP
jgi:hypothetical protein